MSAYTKTLLIIAGLILIPAILLNNNFVSAQWFSTNNITSNSTPKLPDIETLPDIKNDDNQLTPDENQDLSSPDTKINSSLNQNSTNNFPFIDTSDFPSLDDWGQILLPNTLIDNSTPDIPDIAEHNQSSSPNLASRWEQWQKIANQPIGVDVDTQEKAKIFQERKQVFDSWFKQEWQHREAQEAQCQQWWCITTPNWAKDLSYALWKFDFSADWAWNQFEKDHMDNQSI